MSLISFQEVLSDQVSFGDIRKLSGWITIDELKRLPRGYGSRAGVILHTESQFIFNLSNRNLISDFGGGVKAKHSPYYGLLKELCEECPQWVDEIVSRMDRLQVPVHCIESYHLYDESSTKAQIRFSILVFVPFDEALLETFQPTKEVQQIVQVQKEELGNIVLNRSVNSGVSQLAKLLVK
jgi:hypothetical protein